MSSQTVIEESVSRVRVQKKANRKAAKKEKSEKGDHQKVFVGLCGNCDERKTCIFAKAESGVWHCEEYKSVEEDAKIDCTRIPVKEKDRDEKKFTGLCVNCDNRKTCILVKPEGGVLHCEQYE